MYSRRNTPPSARCSPHLTAPGLPVGSLKLGALRFDICTVLPADNQRVGQQNQDNPGDPAKLAISDHLDAFFFGYPPNHRNERDLHGWVDNAPTACLTTYNTLLTPGVGIG